MIRITRSQPPPTVLTTRGQAERARLIADFEADPDPYRLGTKPTFDSSIYANPKVKDELLAMQRGKCAFCESKVRHVGYGDVEHFRPKAAYTQIGRPPLKRPGYFWLAYDWDNLFFSCQLCNQQFKRNHFPLRDGRRRARSHRTVPSNESPLLLDPCATPVEMHLSFTDETAVPVANSPEGATTIELLGLNRTELLAYRRQHLGVIREYRAAHEILLALQRAGILSSHEQPTLLTMQARLASWQEADSEYAAMTRALLR